MEDSHYTGEAEDSHYTGEMEDIIIDSLAVVCQIAAPKIRAFSCGLMTLC